MPLDEVEPAKEIVKRFATGAMSLGSISTEAHHAGHRHEPHRWQVEYRRRWRGCQRFAPVGAATAVGHHRQTASSATQIRKGLAAFAIKQVASGRFGVTTEYLVNADQIQIKMAQGAKAGRRRPVAGHKVSANTSASCVIRSRVSA